MSVEDAEGTWALLAQAKHKHGSDGTHFSLATAPAAGLAGRQTD